MPIMGAPKAICEITIFTNSDCSDQKSVAMILNIRICRTFIIKILQNNLKSIYSTNHKTNSL